MHNQPYTYIPGV
jgi:hypothetical protein